MTRIETIERLQFLSFVLALLLLLGGFASMASLVERATGVPNLYVMLHLGSVLLLLGHNVFTSLKVENLEHFDRYRNYWDPAFVSSFFLQIGFLGHVLASENLFAFPDWQIWLVAGSMLGTLNLFLPAAWRIRVVQTRSRARKDRILLGLRQEIQRKTEVLLNREVLPELERMRRGELISKAILEQSLETALDKISGIEDILRYIILDKYLELLEEAKVTLAIPRCLKVVTVVAVVTAMLLLALLEQVF